MPIIKHMELAHRLVHHSPDPDQNDVGISRS